MKIYILFFKQRWCNKKRPKMKISLLIKHIEVSHQLLKLTKDKIELDISGTNFKDKNVKTESCLQHWSVEEHAFLLHIVRNKGFWFNWMYVFYAPGMGEQPFTYEITLKSHNDPNEKLEFCSNCIRLEEYQARQMIEGDVHCLVFTDSMVQKYMRQDAFRNKLQYNIKIMKK